HRRPGLPSPQQGRGGSRLTLTATVDPGPREPEPSRCAYGRQQGGCSLAAGGDDDDPSIALTGGTVVVSLDPPQVVDADLVITAGRVSTIGAAPPGATRRDCSRTLVIPGNV